MPERAIIHLNVADFAVAVERMLDRRLAKRPVVIAPAAGRTAVYDMSDEAYRTGVRKGMPLNRALRRCRDAAVLPPRFERYEHAMGALIKQALHYSPLIEPGRGDGHLFVDVTGTGRLFGLPVDIAWRLRKQARRDIGLDPIWSVAPNKLVAKVATRVVKPAGEYIVAAGEEEAFLAPLPLCLIPGIAPEDLQRFRELNLQRAGDAAALDRHQLEIACGGRAAWIYNAVRGIDAAAVRPLAPAPPRVQAAHAFSGDTNDAERLEQALYVLSETTGRDLRRRQRAARRLRVCIDYSDGRRAARQQPVSPPSADDAALFSAARKALTAAWKRRTRIRRICLTAAGLVPPPAQLALFPGERRQQRIRENLCTALDRIHERFGPCAVQTGRSLALRAARERTD